MFGKRLKTIRKEYKLTQLDLANLLNVARSTIGMYELGERNPDTETVVFLSNHFEVSSDWLLGLSDVRNPYIDKKNMHKNAYLNLSSLSCESIEQIEEYIELLIIRENLKDD